STTSQTILRHSEDRRTVSWSGWAIEQRDRFSASEPRNDRSPISPRAAVSAHRGIDGSQEDDRCRVAIGARRAAYVEKPTQVADRAAYSQDSARAPMNGAIIESSWIDMRLHGILRRLMSSSVVRRRDRAKSAP